MCDRRVLGQLIDILSDIWYLIRYLNFVEIWCLLLMVRSDRVQMFDLASLKFSQSCCGYCVIIMAGRKKEETVNLKNCANILTKSKKLKKGPKICQTEAIVSSSRPGGKREKRVNLKNCLRTNLSNGLSSSVSFSTQTDILAFQKSI